MERQLQSLDEVWHADAADLPAQHWLGEIEVTAEAFASLQSVGQDPNQLLARHVLGDWGDLHELDKEMSQLSFQSRVGVVFSAYDIQPNLSVYVITEWQKNTTSVLLPEEYRERQLRPAAA